MNLHAIVMASLAIISLIIAILSTRPSLINKNFELWVGTIKPYDLYFLWGVIFTCLIYIIALRKKIDKLNNNKSPKCSFKTSLLEDYIISNKNKLLDSKELKVAALNFTTFRDLFVLSENQKYDNIKILTAHPRRIRGYPIHDSRIKHEINSFKTQLFRIQDQSSNYSKLYLRSTLVDPRFRSIMSDNGMSHIGFYFFEKQNSNAVIIPGLKPKGQNIEGVGINKNNLSACPFSKWLSKSLSEWFDTIWYSASIPIYPKPYLLFDFDGTLCNSLNYHLECWKQILNQYSVSNRFNKIKSLMLKGYDSYTIAKIIGIPKGAIDIAVNKKRNLFKKNICKNLFIEEDIKFYLKAFVKKEFNLGLISTNSESDIESVLSNSKIESLFSIIMGRESGVVKPDPKSIELFCKKTNTDINNIIYIGDTISDAKMCYNARIPFLHASFFNQNKAKEIPNWIHISSIKELYNFLVWVE